LSIEAGAKVETNFISPRPLYYFFKKILFGQSLILIAIKWKPQKPLILPQKGGKASTYLI